MTDWIDDACQLEQEQRDRALLQRMHNKVTETPDQDAAGNRYCLDCGEQIPRERLSAEPSATRCVGCQACVEKARRHRYGV